MQDICLVYISLRKEAVFSDHEDNEYRKARIAYIACGSPGLDIFLTAWWVLARVLPSSGQGCVSTLTEKVKRYFTYFLLYIGGDRLVFSQYWGGHDPPQRMRGYALGYGTV